MEIQNLKADEKKQLITLTSEATLDNLKYKSTPLLLAIKDTIVKKQKAVRIQTKDGVIVVTPNHPLITSDGYMRAAGELQKGQALITKEGKASEILDIKISEYKFRSYNVEAEAYRSGERIVVAQGFLSGDLYYQNAGLRYLNRKLLRDAQPISSTQY